MEQNDPNPNPDRIKHVVKLEETEETEELEETSSVAAGDVGGFSGGAFENFNAAEENEKHAKDSRLKKEELVEKVMNYLLKKSGAQYAD